MPTHTYRVPLRDGITLAADLFLPEEGTGPWPVLIARSPYRRQGLAFLGEFSRHGYAVLIQDVRGTGESGGEFGFVGQEPPDALDTADWILAQPWCDGRLGIFGLSYLAAASLAIAAERPDHVRACVWVTLPAHPRWQAWQNGALRLHHILPWALQAARQDLSAYDWPAAYWTPPAVPLVQALQEPAHPYWQQSDLTRYLSRVKAPGLHLAGWYDFMLDAALEPYDIVAASSGWLLAPGRTTAC